MLDSVQRSRHGVNRYSFPDCVHVLSCGCLPKLSRVLAEEIIHVTFDSTRNGNKKSFKDSGKATPLLVSVVGQPLPEREMNLMVRGAVYLCCARAHTLASTVTHVHFVVEDGLAAKQQTNPIGRTSSPGDRRPYVPFTPTSHDHGDPATGSLDPILSYAHGRMKPNENCVKCRSFYVHSRKAQLLLSP